MTTTDGTGRSDGTGQTAGTGRKPISALLLAMGVPALLAVGALLARPAAANTSDLELRLLAELFQLRNLSKVTVQSEAVIKRTGESETRQVVLRHDQLGEMRLKIRAPLASGRYPVLFLCAGVRAGMDSLDLIPIEVPMVLAAFDYPVSKSASETEVAAELARSAVRLQGQLAVALAWLSERPNARADRLNTLNVSFGTFVAPLAQRLVQVMGLEIYSTIMAFGGAELSYLIRDGLDTGLSGALSPADAAITRAALESVASVFDPKHHLPYLRGRFLVIRGARDEVIPPEANQAQFNLLPEPKRLAVLNTPHINQDRVDVIAKTVETSFRWLKEQGAL